MSSTIRTTIESVISERVGTVPAGYQPVVDAVIEAVEGLAEQAADSLRESGSSVASPEQIESALVAAGLVEPEPVVEDVPQPEDPTRDGRIRSLEEKVDRLVALAERHLGRI